MITRGYLLEVLFTGTDNLLGHIAQPFAEDIGGGVEALFDGVVGGIHGFIAVEGGDIHGGNPGCIVAGLVEPCAIIILTGKRFSFCIAICKKPQGSSCMVVLCFEICLFIPEVTIIDCKWALLLLAHTSKHLVQWCGCGHTVLVIVNAIN